MKMKRQPFFATMFAGLVVASTLSGCGTASRVGGAITDPVVLAGEPGTVQTYVSERVDRLFGPNIAEVFTFYTDRHGTIHLIGDSASASPGAFNTLLRAGAQVGASAVRWTGYDPPEYSSNETQFVTGGSSRSFSEGGDGFTSSSSSSSSGATSN